MLMPMSISTCQCRDKTRTFILTSMMTGNSINAFHHVFTITFYVATFKNFFLLTKLLISTWLSLNRGFGGCDGLGGLGGFNELDGLGGFDGFSTFGRFGGFGGFVF